MYIGVHRDIEEYMWGIELYGRAYIQYIVPLN